MITIFGTTYFTIGTGLVVLALVAPFALWLSRWMWRPNVEGKPRHVRWLAVGGTTLGLLLLAAVGLFWDVYLIGQRAKELCAETGLVVYRQASADGFLGDTNIEYWSRVGFKFLEYRIDGRILRTTFHGEISAKEFVDSAASQFELIIFSTTPDYEKASYGHNKFRQHISRVVERTSGEILGQLGEYSIRPGWLDRTVLSLTGFSFTPWRCSRSIDGGIVLDSKVSRLNEHDLVKAVLIPPR